MRIASGVLNASWVIAAPMLFSTPGERVRGDHADRGTLTRPPDRTETPRARARSGTAPAAAGAPDEGKWARSPDPRPAPSTASRHRRGRVYCQAPGFVIRPPIASLER